MVKIVRLLLLLFIVISAHAQDTVNNTLTREQFIRTQTIKADTLNQMALQLAQPGANSKDLNQAIEYIMKGLHVYSKFRDSTGLRETFDHLGLVYHLQKKYVQAKWFYIQSNSISREKNDTLNIIYSLINLAAVKTDIKDFSLANRDLKEALELTKQIQKIDLQVEMLKHFVDFYTQKGDAKKASFALNRIIFIKDSVQKQTETRLAIAKQQEQAQQLKVLQQKQQTIKSEESRLQNLIHQKNGITTISVLVISLLAILCFIFYLKKKRKKRRHKK